VEINIPTLYVMGEEDYMFLPSVRQVVERHYRSSKLFVIENCGHVVNVEQPNQFNQAVISFVKSKA
jgi:pimeloyl-ACP methyl ester carboxylesterase